MDGGSIESGNVPPAGITPIAPFTVPVGGDGTEDSGNLLAVSSISKNQMDTKKIVNLLASHPELLPGGMLDQKGLVDLDLFSVEFMAVLAGTNTAGISDISSFYNVEFDTSGIINNILDNMAKTNEETAKILKEADKKDAVQQDLRDEIETTSAALLANQSISFMGFMALFSAGADGAPMKDFGKAFGTYVSNTLQSEDFKNILTTQARAKVELTFPDMDAEAKSAMTEKWVEMTKATIAYTALGVVLQESDFSGGQIDTLIDKAESPVRELLDQVTASVNVLSTMMTPNEIKTFFADVQSKNRSYIEDQGLDPVVMLHSFMNYLGEGGGVDIPPIPV